MRLPKDTAPFSAETRSTALLWLQPGWSRVARSLHAKSDAHYGLPEARVLPRAKHKHASSGKKRAHQPAAQCGTAPKRCPRWRTSYVLPLQSARKHRAGALCCYHVRHRRSTRYLYWLD